MDPDDILPDLYQPTPDADPVVQADIDANIALDAEIKPDEEGRLLDLSRESGLDVDTLRQQSASRISYLQTRPTRLDVLKRNADIAQWHVDNPMNAALASDDAAALEDIKRNMSGWLAQDAKYHRDTAGERVAASVANVLKSVPSGIGGLYRGAYGLVRLGAEAVGADSLADFAARQSGIGKDLASHIAVAMGESWEAVDEANETLARQNFLKFGIGTTEISAEDIGAGLLSIVPTLLAGPMGWGAVLTAAGAQTAGGAFADLRDRGDSTGKAGTLAIVEGLITGAITHFIPGAQGSIRRMIANSQTKVATTKAILTKALGATAVSEMSQEGLDQFIQVVLNEATDTMNPKEWSAILHHAVSEGLKAGLIGGFSGAVVGVGEAKHAAAIVGALNFHKENTALAASIDASKFGQRTKVGMQDFLGSMGFNQNSVVHVAAEDAMALIGGGAEQARALAALGITTDSVEKARAYGGSIAVRADKLLTTEAGLRDRVLEVGRKTASAMNSVEATEAQKLLDEKKAETQEEKTQATKFAKDIRTEEARIIKSFAAKAGTDEKTMRQTHAPLFAAARALYLTDPDAARSTLGLLKRWRVNKTGQSREEIMQQIVDLAGPEGKTALSRVSFQDIGQISGRLDVLTGQLQVNEKALPDAVSVGKLLQVAKESAVEFSGRTVNVADATGKREPVDAGAAVRTLRQRVEAGRRLADCIS